MVRVAVISDSHGNFRHLGVLRSKLGGRLDWLLHAGDHMRDAERIGVNLGVDPSRIRAVVGNCDYPAREPAQELLEIGGVKILLTHGHLYGVKDTLDRIYYRAEELGARVAVFGHSHIPVSVEEGGILLFNPGSISSPRLAGDSPSCGLLEIDHGVVTARHLFSS